MEVIGRHPIAASSSARWALLGTPDSQRSADRLPINTNAPRPHERYHQELPDGAFLAVLEGLLITDAAVNLACEHPTWVQPLGVRAAVMSTLAAVTGVVAAP